MNTEVTKVGLLLLPLQRIGAQGGGGGDPRDPAVRKYFSSGILR